MKEISSFLNVFLEKYESYKLFGNNEVYYYIQDGNIVNNVNDDLSIKKLYYSSYNFNWSQQFLNENILYQILIETNLKRTFSNFFLLTIPKVGLISDHLPGFSIFINCSDIRKVIILTINMVFVAQRQYKTLNPIKLKITRLINCSDKEVGRTQFSSIHSPDSYNTPSGLGIALCAAVLGITVVSIIAVIIKRFIKSDHINPHGLCYRSERTYSKKPIFTSSANQSSQLKQDISCNKYAVGSSIKDETIERSMTKEMDNDNDSFFTSSSVGTHQTGATPIVKRRFNDPLQIINEIQIPRNRITLKKLLLEGTFCQMYEGVMSPQNRRYGGVNKKVMIKTVADSSTLSQTNVLIKDGTLLAGLKNRNLCPIIAACTASFQGIDMIQPPWLIYRYTEPGNLKLVLRRNAFQENDIAVTFSTPHLIVIAIQLLRALKYLHNRNILHKDIATRNCFLNGRNQALLSDSALSRDLFPEDYQCLGDNENRPVKWLSVEALIQRRFGQSSDIWAFGILLWELVNKADDPYAEVDPFEMPTFLRNGYRLRQPKNCPDNLWTIMNDCWVAEVSKRPLLNELMKKLKSFQEILTEFV